MAREMNFTGWWEGQVEYSCDCCGKAVTFDFEDEETAKDFKAQRKVLREEFGWIVARVNGVYRDFHSEECRDRYIRNNTI